jgi:hypothetical protein
MSSVRAREAANSCVASTTERKPERLRSAGGMQIILCVLTVINNCI